MTLSRLQHLCERRLPPSGSRRSSELGRRIGKNEKEVRRILDPKHATKLPTMVEALRALGKRMVVGIEEAA